MAFFGMSDVGQALVGDYLMEEVLRREREGHVDVTLKLPLG